MSRISQSTEPAPTGMAYEITYGLLNKPGGSPVETYQIQGETIREVWDHAELSCQRWENELVERGLRKSRAKAMTFIYPPTLVSYVL